MNSALIELKESWKLEKNCHSESCKKKKICKRWSEKLATSTIIIIIIIINFKRETESLLIAA